MNAFVAMLAAMRPHFDYTLNNKYGVLVTEINGEKGLPDKSYWNLSVDGK